MKSKPTPHVATGFTSEELSVTFGPTAGLKHDVVVPAGTRCKKLDGGSDPWVVDDLSFLPKENSFLYSDANIYGIRIPEDKIKDIQEVNRPAPRFR